MTSRRHPRQFRHRLRAKVLSAALLATACHSFGGAIVLRDGSEIIGNVKLVAPDEVTVEWPGMSGAHRARLADIASIELGDTPASAQPNALPSPWRSGDIGAVTKPGATTFTNAGDAGRGAVRLEGSGWGVWSGVDSCHFAYQELDGDGQIIARVPAFARDTRVAAGVMIRSSLEPRAPMAAMMVDTYRQLRFNSRPLTRFTLENQPPLVAERATSRWLRLARVDRWVTAYRSDDGASWTPIGWQEIDLPQRALIGLAVASTANVGISAATFGQVRVIRGPVQTAPLPFTSIPARGIVNVDGSSIPGAALRWATSDNIGFTDAGESSQTRPLASVAWAVVDPTFPDLHTLGSANGPGVALKSGDYLGGEIRAVGNGFVAIDSILFGPKTYDLATEVAAVLFRTPAVTGEGYHVRTKSGVTHAAKSLRFEGDQVRIGDQSLPAADVALIVRTR